MITLLTSINRWRLYEFKGDEQTNTLHLHRCSCYIFGKDRSLNKFPGFIPTDHPSCSRQHAVIQFRLKVRACIPHGHAACKQPLASRRREGASRNACLLPCLPPFVCAFVCMLVRTCMCACVCVFFVRLRVRVRVFICLFVYVCAFPYHLTAILQTNRRRRTGWAARSSV